MSANGGNVEAVFRALLERRRRIAVRCLQDHQQVTLADLAELVCERETNTDLVHLSPEEVTEVYSSLYHNHLPLLVDANLATYDQEEDLVELADDAKPTLDCARTALNALMES